MKKRRKRYKIVFLCVGILGFAVSALLFAVGLNKVQANKETINEGFERQHEEESLADLYIEYLMSLCEEGTADIGTIIDIPSRGEVAHGSQISGDPSTEETEAPPVIEWYDDNYFQREGVTFTPDYAVGYLAFVLEYPKIQIRRGVYCAGSYAELNQDLDMWMTVLYNPLQRLGETHLAIFAHNSLTQDLSFNRVRESSIGDVFYLYGTSGIYEYVVTDIRCESRETVTNKYVLSEQDKNKVFIATCGRDDIFTPDGNSTRYRDFVIEGTLHEKYPLSSYASLVIKTEADWQMEK